MKSIFLFFVIMFCNVIRLEAASLYVGADFSSSMSPHGAGLVVGGEIDPIGIEAGYGLFAKNQLAGNPISVIVMYRIIKVLRILVGESMYSGSGVRDVVYNNGLETTDLNATWTFYYMHFGARLDMDQIHFLQSLVDRGFHFFIESGFGIFQSGNVSVDKDYDVSNLGKPVGIRVENLQYSGGVMGPGDWGPYLGLGVTYDIL